MARNPSKVTGIPGGSLSIEGGFMQAYDSAADMLTIQGSSAQAGDLLNLSMFAGSTISANEVVTISASGAGTWPEMQAFYGGRRTGIVTVACGTTTYTVLSSNTGKAHILPGVTKGLYVTLPAVSSGLHYKFFVKAVSGSNGLGFLCGNPGLLYYGAVADANTVRPASAADCVGGAMYEFFSDGTNWFLNHFPANATASELLTVGTSGG
jgi:hypothetical protein